MATAARDVRRGIAWAALSATAYSASAILGKHLLDDLRANDLLFWRFSIAIPVCWIVLAARARRGGPNPLDVARRPLVAVGVLFCYMSWIGFVALDHLDTSLYIVLVYVYPAFVAAAAPLFGHRVPATTWLAIGVTILGIALTVPDVFGDGGRRGDVIGVVLTLVQAVALATYTIVSSRVVGSRVVGRTDGLVTMGWSLCGSWLGMAALAVAIGLQVPGDGRVVAELVGFAIVPTIVSGACFYQALRYLAPTHVAMIATLEPVLTILWAVLLLGDRLRAIQVAGGALVLVGVVWAQRSASQLVVEANRSSGSRVHGWRTRVVVDARHDAYGANTAQPPSSGTRTRGPR
ncbi:MAG: DMT family transporter [Ilumatobacteraceae bacterium]